MDIAPKSPDNKKPDKQDELKCLVRRKKVQHYITKACLKIVQEWIKLLTQQFYLCDDTARL
jgi:hypothetical protein